MSRSLVYINYIIKFNIIKMSDIVDNKNYYNPCVPYNVGLRNSIGDKIIIQNQIVNMNILLIVKLKMMIMIIIIWI